VYVPTLSATVAPTHFTAAAPNVSALVASPPVVAPINYGDDAEALFLLSL